MLSKDTWNLKVNEKTPASEWNIIIKMKRIRGQNCNLYMKKNHRIHGHKRLINKTYFELSTHGDLK